MSSNIQQKTLNESKLWSLCDRLREDGIDNKDYVPQISPLLFLKAVESKSNLIEDEMLPDIARWNHLLEAAQNPSNEKNIIELYDEIITELQNNDKYDYVNNAFSSFNSQFKTISVLSKLVKNIESEFNWSQQDFLGDSYEYILERHANESKGAGEYFTPRPIIKAIVGVMDPDCDETIFDPAAGTNGFITESYRYVGNKHSNKYGMEFADSEYITYKNNNNTYDENLYLYEINNETYRLGLMNVLLHKGNPNYLNHERENTLLKPPKKLYNKDNFNLILANPPYGSSVINKYDNAPNTSNPVVNFMQLIMDHLDDNNGRAAVIVPEGILFNTNKSATSIRNQLLENYNLDCILTLPNDSFEPYAGVDANVLFFNTFKENTDEFWYYDCRTDYDKINKSNPLDYNKHLSDFVENWETREESENYFKVNIDSVDENKELQLSKYKEYKYDTHRPPLTIKKDIKKELNTIENLIGDDI